MRRLSGRTERLYVTVWPITVRARYNHPAVSRQMREVCGRRQAQVRKRPGHVRLRRKIEPGSEWQIELFAGAQGLRRRAGAQDRT